MNLLREYVKLILREDAFSPVQAEKEDLSLMIANVMDSKMYVLYDAKTMVEMLRRKAPFSVIAPKAIYGVVMIEGPYTRAPGKAWNAAEVNATAARDGYGPMMYDIAMASEGGLVPDRDAVSDTAKAVWSYYKNHRSDVTAKPLDDFNDPKTPPVIDDAQLHPDGKKNPLNYAYFTNKTPNVSALVANHNAAKKELKWVLPKDYKLVDHVIAEIADEFFQKKYYAGRRY